MAALVVVFIWLLIDLIIKTSADHRRGVTDLSAKSTKISSEIFDLKKMEEIEELDLNWGRDPFYFDVVQENAAPLELAGILWDENNPQAILNDDIVGLGAVVEGYTVATIAEQYIILKKGNSEKKLQLY